MEKVILTTESELEAILGRVIDKKINQKEKIEKTFSINQVAKLLKRSHKKITDLVNAGILKCTPDRRVYESSIKEYNNQ